MKKLIILLSIFFGFAAYANLNLESPVSLLEKAQKGRTELRDVILDIDINLPEMRDRQTFEGYFALVPQLVSLSQESGLEELYPKIVAKLGEKMVGHGIRWMDLSKESPEVVLRYAQWMNADAFSRLYTATEYNMPLVTTDQGLKNLVVNMEAMFPYLVKATQDQSFIQAGYTKLISDIAVVFLKKSELSKEERLFWIGKVKNPSYFSEYIEFLVSELYKVDGRNSKYLSSIMDQFVVMRQTAFALGNVPNWVEQSIKSAQIEILIRHIRYESSLKLNVAKEVLATFNNKELRELMTQWMTIETIPSTGFAESYFEIYKTTMVLAKEASLSRDVDVFEKWLSTIAAAVQVRAQKIEGHYAVTTKSGKKFGFTLAYARDNMVIAALGAESGALSVTYYNVVYNPVDKVFVASLRDADFDSPSNAAISFTVSADKKINIKNMYSRNADYAEFSGSLKSSFSDLWEKRKGQKVDAAADGIYKGSLLLPSGKRWDVTVIITKFNGYTLGRLEAANADLDFGIGAKSNDGVIILTTGRGNATWTQLRGFVSEAGLEVQMVVGGRGISATWSTLKRVTE